MKTDVLIIGGSAGGILSATTSRKVNPEKKVTVVRKTDTVMVPCGIPYIYGTLKDPAKNRIPDAALTGSGTELVVDEIVSVDAQTKTAVLAKGEPISYDKLVFATGSLPVIPKFIEGYDKKNVFPVYKDETYLTNLLTTIKDMNNIVVIGGGFIGVEFAEQLKKDGKNVTLIEAMNHCLWQSFDEETCIEVDSLLTKNGITVMANTKVKAIQGAAAVKNVLLEDGTTIAADAVLLGIGVIPNSTLAQKMGIAVNDKGAILTDEYQRTNIESVFAVGDCAEKKCFFTGKNIPVLLASTAAMEAKIAGQNLYKLKYPRMNKGVIGAFSTCIFGTGFAAAGMTARTAKQEGFEIIEGKTVTMDKHPGSLPNTHKNHSILLFDKYTGVLLGAQLFGGESVGEMINMFSLAIQKGMTANELNTIQVATHPLLTSSPLTYPANAASYDALLKL